MKTFFNEWTERQLVSVIRAQKSNADLYRQWMRLSPWNSKTRQGWLELATNAENIARHAQADLKGRQP